MEIVGAIMLLVFVIACLVLAGWAVWSITGWKGVAILVAVESYLVLAILLGYGHLG